MAAGLAMLAGAGCAPKELANVHFSYVVEPSKGLPPGMHNISIEPARFDELSNPAWARFSVGIMQDLVSESQAEFGTDIVLSDRRDTQVTFDEVDLQAAGMAGDNHGRGELLGVQGKILSNISVKVDKQIGKESTISNIFAAGGGGKGIGGGGFDIDTREVETVRRTITVQTEFKLVDAGDNRVWEYSTVGPMSRTDKTSVSPLFGHSATEAELPSTDKFVQRIVERGARDFVSRLMPTRIRVTTEVKSSHQPDCEQGVRLLRVEEYEAALKKFKKALSRNHQDHHAAYGAGVACEALGRYEEALSYYKRALIASPGQKYKTARDRVKAYGQRARPARRLVKK